eukprot:m.477198 g.477198  ORF g.477198 m.477198 type:complete len:62 (-) comp20774_c0_seq1:1905-2090(-)
MNERSERRGFSLQQVSQPQTLPTNIAQNVAHALVGFFFFLLFVLFVFVVVVSPRCLALSLF